MTALHKYSYSLFRVDTFEAFNDVSCRFAPDSERERSRQTYRHHSPVGRRPLAGLDTFLKSNPLDLGRVCFPLRHVNAEKYKHLKLCFSYYSYR